MEKGSSRVDLDEAVSWLQETADSKEAFGIFMDASDKVDNLGAFRKSKNKLVQGAKLKSTPNEAVFAKILRKFHLLVAAEPYFPADGRSENGLRDPAVGRFSAVDVAEKYLAENVPAYHTSSFTLLCAQKIMFDVHKESTNESPATNGGDKCALITLPPGQGKTFIQLIIAIYYAQKGVRVVIVVHDAQVKSQYTKHICLL